MKKMNIVRNTITEGTETYRERSRIGSINHRIWSVIAPMHSIRPLRRKCGSLGNMYV